MPHSDRLIDDEETSGPAKKNKKFAFDNLERVLLVLSVLLLITAVQFSLRMRGSKGTGEEHGLPTLEILWVALASDVEPENYDSSKELRIPLAEVQPGGGLKPFVVRLRGPWTFGVTDIETAALLLGQPSRRGAGFLLYDLADGRIRVTVLFNSERLDTVAIEPNPCPGDQTDCEQPYLWGLTKAQIREEGLEWSEKANDDLCGTMSSHARAVYYKACRAAGRPNEPGVTGVFVQRINKEVLNPPYLRGITRPDSVQIEPVQRELGENEYGRLLARYEEAIRFKETAVGKDHTTVHFLKFELGRMQIETGREKEGRPKILAAIEGVKPNLGANHPDIEAMRSWVERPKGK